jgi:hypothetical protein
MTELVRARAHLKVEQKALAAARSAGTTVWAHVCEGRVLAALSWVWEAQEREARAMVWRCRDGKMIAISDMGASHIKCCLALILQSGGKWRAKFWAPMRAELERRGNP